LVTAWKDELDSLLNGAPKPREVQERREAERNTWDEKPFKFLVRGVETEFFSIGQFSKALSRSPNTLRAWEREGTFPKSPFVKPSADPRGRRRMYTRAMVEGVVQIARDEGVLFPHKGIKLSDTRFQEKVLALFKQLLRK
jgi:MerR HTH family regulatory protein